MTAVQSPNKSSSGGSGVLVAVLGIVAFFGFAFLAASLLGGEDAVAIDSDGFEASQVELDDVVLDQMPGGVTVTRVGSDSAIGQLAPTVVGQNFSGETVTIENDGRAKAIYFVAHWCPFCQEEVPTLVSTIGDGLVPDGLDIYIVSTSVDSGKVNYPPSAWLDAADWPTPMMRDDNTSSALIAFGAGGFPYSVYLDSDHRVVGRAAGRLADVQTIELWNRAVSGTAGEVSELDTEAPEQSDIGGSESDQ